MKLPINVFIKSSVIFSFSFFLVVNIFCQDFQPCPFVNEDDNLLSKIEACYKNSLSKISDLKKAERDVIEDIYKDKKTILEYSLKNGCFILEGDIYDRTQIVFEKLKKNNPEIDPNNILLLSREPITNAVSYGNGIIVVYMKLLSRIENDDQLAFILGHELSHQQLQHSYNKCLRDAKDATDKELIAERKKLIKKIIKDEYRISTNITNLILPEISNTMRHSRNFELESDSLGFILAQNAGYGKIDALKVINLLDTCDQDVYQNLIPLKEIFNFNESPFQDVWLMKEEASSLGVFEKKKFTFEDSLKTHPDCNIRKEKLIKNYWENAIPELPVKGVSIDYSSIQKKSSFELVESYYYSGSYSRALYQCLHLLEEYPDDEYLNNSLSRILLQVAIFKKERQIGKYFSQTSNNYSESYNQMITCLWNMGNKDCAKLGEIILSQKCKPSESEGYLAANAFNSYLKNNKEEFLKYHEVYLNKYPNGVEIEYLKFLKTKISINK